MAGHRNATISLDESQLTLLQLPSKHLDHEASQRNVAMPYLSVPVRQQRVQDGRGEVLLELFLWKTREFSSSLMECIKKIVDTYTAKPRRSWNENGKISVLLWIRFFFEEEDDLNHVMWWFVMTDQNWSHRWMTTEDIRYDLIDLAMRSCSTSLVLHRNKINEVFSLDYLIFSNLIFQTFSQQFSQHLWKNGWNAKRSKPSLPECVLSATCM